MGCMYEWETASAPFRAGLTSCTDHLSVDELIEVVRSRGGEAELNDLLRHAVNRLVRPQHWIVEREVSDPTHRLSRVDLAMSETGSGMRFAWVEAKYRIATDAIENPGFFIDEPQNAIAKDVAKLRSAQTITPTFLLTWVVHLTHSAFRVRYGAGHDVTDDGWRTRLGLAECREACATLLGALGPTERVEVKSGTGTHGSITLDAWWTWVIPAMAGEGLPASAP